MDDDNTKDILNNLINQYIKDNVNEIINLINENDVDFIGFGNYIYRNNYKDYKNFDLKNTKINIVPKSLITSFGESRKKIGDIDEKNK